MTPRRIKDGKKLLKESLQDIKKLAWPNLTPGEVVYLARLSPTWTPDADKAEIEMELGDEVYSALTAALGEIYAGSGRTATDFVKISAPARTPPVLDAAVDPPTAAAFQTACARLKLGKAQSRGGRVRMEGDEERLAAAAKVLAALKKSPDAVRAIAGWSAEAMKMQQGMAKLQQDLKNAQDDA